MSTDMKRQLFFLFRGTGATYYVQSQGKQLTLHQHNQLDIKEQKLSKCVTVRDMSS